MAQLGSYVTADRCHLSPVDRIFTRIGASDNIMYNQSTFMVELAETSSIMKYATRRSLVILDELGRGTSTFDGYSIAYSVLKYFAESVPCRMLFATHYHLLTDEFKKFSTVANYQMQTAMIDEKLVFLYTVEKGVCPKSYGMNVAQLAGVDQSIIDRAEQVAVQFENSSKLAVGRSSEMDKQYLEKLSARDRSLLSHVMGSAQLQKNEQRILIDLWKSLKKYSALK
eukprot:TRINITY_DN17832_c0_g1_i1.p1 TRINITY_DN17832_c0_g1~~TRINITY_DN17832_c0_g1_i1.p1  ORF type:complete len:257 (-),score=65.38 TRINITY_DN17832_c0_g1_i1:6-683(-)